MKKFIIITSAALAALSACSKVENVVESQREISFQVANYLNTRAAGVKYENGNFGTYSWHNATDPFMTNEEVGEVGGQWKTVNHTFYWPKTGSIDFISYSPFAGTNAVAGTVPTVTKNGSSYSISYSGYEVGQDDIMYADLATCNSNVNEVTDNVNGGTDSGYEGVPTLFHHALAKVNFNIRANFTEYGSDDDKTTWEIKVISAKIDSIYTTGSCSLSWNASAGEWTRPTGDVWTPTAAITSSDIDLGEGMTLTTTAQPLTDLGFVLPQALEDQYLELTVAIKTTLSNGNVLNETWNSGHLPLAKLVTDLDSWKMNHIINYTINIKPTATSETNPNPDNPEDVTILFDPAVADWVVESADLTIQL